MLNKDEESQNSKDYQNEKNLKMIAANSKHINVHQKIKWSQKCQLPEEKTKPKYIGKIKKDNKPKKENNT